MLRIPIRSRLGNAVLGVVGALYLVSATVTLVYYLVTTWGAASLLDRLLQVALLGSALAGVFFIVVALDNLGLLHLLRSTENSRSSRDHRTAAATEQ